jgi:hypothetical protein
MGDYVVIKLSNGGESFVSVCDAEMVRKYKWRRTNNGYARATVKNKKTYLHRYILGADNGVCVDHINRNPLDNRRENLRLATHSQNMQNSTRSSNKNTPRGVFSAGRGYCATISHENKTHYLGWSESEEDAARIYDAVARNVHGDFAVTNFDGLESMSISEARRKYVKRPSSPYKGVYCSNQGLAWYASITVSGKRTFLGVFDTDVDAAIAYDAFILDNGLKRPLNILRR